MPTGLIIKPDIGFSGMSKSLARPPEPFFSVRMVPLGSVGKQGNYVYGDEATIDFLSALAILWGTTTPTAYDSLQTGWLWVWNIHTRMLTITDASGTVTTRNAPTWSDLCVSIDVLESHQFQYYFDASFENNPFIIGSLREALRHSKILSFIWGENDRYLSAAFHILFVRLRNWMYSDNDGFGILDMHTLQGIIDTRKALTAIIRSLTADGLYPMNLLDGFAVDTVAAPHKINRGALLEALGNYLFVSLLTASLLMGNKNHNKPCYEPWMLWQMFKWLQKASTVELEDRIFDLSPNWG